jgi:hypothetical protein
LLTSIPFRVDVRLFARPESKRLPSTVLCPTEHAGHKSFVLSSLVGVSSLSLTYYLGRLFL